MADACRLGNLIDDTRRAFGFRLSTRWDNLFPTATGRLAALDLPFLRRRFEMVTRDLSAVPRLRNVAP